MSLFESSYSPTDLISISFVHVCLLMQIGLWRRSPTALAVLYVVLVLRS